MLAMKTFLLLGVLSVVVTASPGKSRAISDDVHYLLYTRSNPNSAHEMFTGDANSISSSNFKNSDPTIFLIHGWRNSGYDGWPIDAKSELLDRGSYNVVVVDWGALAANLNYHGAVLDVPMVGEVIALFLEYLKVETMMDTSKLQVIGHSLGAHISGQVGESVYVFSVPRITGLDPAGPEFYFNAPSARLDPSDADFVQVIHANGGTVLDGCAGYFDQMGDADFYPNGGEHQPGCVDGSNLEDLLSGGCSHGRAVEFWIESINGSPGFSSNKCTMSGVNGGSCSTCSGSNCVQMGFNVDSGASGVYYLETNNKSPYAQG